MTSQFFCLIATVFFVTTIPAAAQHPTKVPRIGYISGTVDAGGLMSYSTDEFGAFRRAAVYVDKILKGAKAAELPVEQVAKFEFVINLKTAKQIRLNIPQSVLYRADRVVK